MTGRPEPNEYAEYYADYVKRADVDDIIGALEAQIEETTNLIRRVPEEVSMEHRDGKWSIREVVGHLNDAERVFSYREFRFSRNDSKPLASFEQDDYVREGHANERTLKELLEEFAILRQGTVATFRNTTPEIGMRRGTSEREKDDSAGRALCHIRTCAPAPGVDPGAIRV